MSLIIILFIVMLVIFSILWGNRTFSVKTLNQMFYHMIVPCDGTDDGIVSNDLHSIYQHPLLKEFKAIAAAKTENFVNYDGDD